MSKPTKSQAMYVALRGRGMNHGDAVALVMAGPLCRSRYVTSRSFLAWSREWDEDHPAGQDGK